MKRFIFPLQRVLDLRQTQLAMEESRVKQQAAALAELDRQQAAAKTAVISAETEVRETPALAGSDLAALGEFRLSMQLQQKQIARRQQECGQKLAALRTVMMEARRRCLLLERLKEKRLAEWKAACNKELEELAAESYLAGWSRDSP